jgi:hypothetical protein
MKRIFPAAICILFAASGPALPQDRSELKAGCMPEVMKFCANAQRDPAVVKQCLLSQRDKLSNKCRAVVEKH